MPSRIIYPGQGGDGGGGPSPGGGALPTTIIPYQKGGAGQNFSAGSYIPWRESDIIRPVSTLNSATVLPCQSATPTELFEIPASPTFSSINIYYEISVGTSLSGLVICGVELYKNGAPLAYGGMDRVSSRFLGATDGWFHKSATLKRVPVDAGDVFQLYLTFAIGSYVYMRETSSSSINANNCNKFIIEELV